ncbi:uncharacterized protein BX663DRAFT_504587 [Cokeromyces recurvatus]|uniref:uncharacterized protein n=1 Tax=Cokeromyces recurvatus TaxID=90255 RepID=UPI00221EA0CB|nr:uncharacterized protein BX663DRAFT_504587 [Cokeromyces recurvatus]KAI7904287.1 hypothetical protein BX663DRAFT_504587 [Cokeromyces recurvatus]
MKVLGISSAILTVLSVASQLVHAGTTPGPCDTNACKLPDCLCPSLTPPAGLSPKDVPQFVTITFDDSIQPELLSTAHELLDVKNPNGCPAKGSWYVSMMYTDFSLVQQWYAQGNEVADHTFTHVGQPPLQEIAAAYSMLNRYGGIPHGKIKGFRAPFLNYTLETFKEISQVGLKYDTSTTAVIDDCYWPYTLDYGLANDCWAGSCGADFKLPGVWEIPMYAVVDTNDIPQLMDVYLAGTPSEVTNWTKTNFERHYNGNRQPFGIYVHPTHLTNYPGMPDVTDKKNAVVSFIKSLQGMKDVWFVTNEQLLQWMQNPVPASQLAEQPYMKCGIPDVGKEICNGLENITITNGVVSGSLLNMCNFGTTNWATCFNCPATAPTVDNPTPNPSIASTDPKYRHPLPDNCDTVWWDPIAGQCLCSNSTCAYKDVAPASSTSITKVSSATTVMTPTSTIITTNSQASATPVRKADSHENSATHLTTTVALGLAFVSCIATMMLM